MNELTNEHPTILIDNIFIFIKLEAVVAQNTASDYKRDYWGTISTRESLNFSLFLILFLVAKQSAVLKYAT